MFKEGFVELEEYRNDIDKVTAFVSGLCIRGADELASKVTSQYDNTLQPITKAYYDSLGADNFAYSSFLFEKNLYTFADGQSCYGYMLVIAYGPVGTNPADPVKASEHIFVLEMSEDQPIGFKEIKNSEQIFN